MIGDRIERKLSVGLTLKRISFIYLISYLAVTGISFAFFPAMTMELFLSNGDYGEIMPRMVGAIMIVLSFLLFSIFRLGDWRKYSLITILAGTPLVLFLGYVYFLSRDPMFLIIIGVVAMGLIATVFGTVLDRSDV